MLFLKSKEDHMSMTLGHLHILCTLTPNSTCKLLLIRHTHSGSMDVSIY